MSNKVLIVEDEQSFISAYKLAFSNAGIEAVFASNGIEGLKMAESENPKVILLDLVMPEMDGYTFLQRFKQNSKISHIPVYVMSSLPQVAIESSVDKSAIAGILNKTDYTPKKIIETIKHLL